MPHRFLKYARSCPLHVEKAKYSSKLGQISFNKYSGVDAEMDHCPKCNSKNIKVSDKKRLPDEIIVYSAVLDCLDCGHWTDILVV